jgi:hypothetical protein
VYTNVAPLCDVFILTESPRITVAPTDQKVSENGIVSFFCRATGNPTPEVYWRRAGKRINSNNNRYTVVNAPQTSGSTSSSGSGTGGGAASATGGGSGGSVLRIETAKPRKDDATFECVAENGVGDPVVATAKLDVYPEGQGKLAVHLRFRGRKMAVEKRRARARY